MGSFSGASSSIRRRNINMKLLRTKEKVFKDEWYELTAGFELQVSYVDGMRTDSFLRAPDPLKSEWANDDCIYVAKIDEFKEALKTKAYSDSKTPGEYNSYWWYDYTCPNLYEEISKNGFDITKVVFNISSSHNFMDYTGNYFTMVCDLTYIDGFRQKCEYRNYKWGKLKAHLKQHPNVLSLEEQLIPHYNADFYGQKGLRLRLLIPPEWRLKGQNGWDMKRIIFSEEDPFNIKQFEKTEEDDD